jgi:hypothetical protein
LLDGTPIAVVWDEPMAGVGRPWFECPQCGGRCRHVYLREVIACRRCCRLDYACRHRHRAIPGFGRLLYLRRKIGADPKPFTPIAPRPRTHVRYHRIADQIRALEERLVGHLGGIVSDLERRIRVRKAKGKW